MKNALLVIILLISSIFATRFFIFHQKQILKQSDLKNVVKVHIH